MRDQILDDGYGSDVLVHYEEMEAGHSTFMVGLNMKYLESLVRVISRYNPIPDDIEEIEKDFNLPLEMLIFCVELPLSIGLRLYSFNVNP